eukprot:1632733-Pyramimonas_sp.AAC.1
MERRGFPTCGFRLSSARIRLQILKRFADGVGWFSTCDSRPSAAHIRLQKTPELRSLGGGPQYVAVALSLRFFSFAKVERIRVVNVPEIVPWNGSGLPGRSSYFGSRC